MKIISWNLSVKWEDGTTENIADVPDYVADPVDEHLTSLEREDSYLTPENMKIYMEHLKKVDDKVEKAIQKELNER